ncbi:hypothetical protein KIPB_014691, partial [Kipferlia bialata]|eukprot:g14691.t1
MPSYFSLSLSLSLYIYISNHPYLQDYATLLRDLWLVLLGPKTHRKVTKYLEERQRQLRRASTKDLRAAQSSGISVPYGLEQLLQIPPRRLRRYAECMESLLTHSLSLS